MSGLLKEATVKRIAWVLIATMMLGVGFSGCEFLFGRDDSPTSNIDTDGDGIPDPEDDDIDGDGLSNDAEITIWRSNPILADTDGDGWADGVETDLGNGFSPLVANMPEMRLELCSSPAIALNYTETSGSSATYGITESSSSTQESTTTYSYAKTASLEQGWSVETSAQVGTEWAVGIALGYNGSYTAEDSWEWGSSTTLGNTQTVEDSEEYASYNEITYTDGTLSVGAKLSNPSDVAYTVDSLTLTAYALDQSSEGAYRAVGSMVLDGGFSAFTLQPGAESGEFDFSKTLSVGSAKDLASNVPSLVFGISGFSSSMTVDGETTDFTQEYTKVAALCAKVIIDYGDASGKEPDQYLAAARTKYNENYSSSADKYRPVSLAEILSYIGLEEGEDYTLDETDGHILSLDGITENAADRSQWVVSLLDGDDEVSYYSAADGYDLGDIVVEPGDRVDLFFSQDKDGDGLVLAMENIYGSSDESADSDGDGIGDFDEVLGWDHDDNTATAKVHTHPALADTDNDGIPDGSDADPVSFFLHASADIATVLVKDYQGTEHAFTEADGIYTGDTLASETATIVIGTREPVDSIAINGSKMKRDADDELLFTYDVSSLRLGDGDYGVVVLSEDGAARTERSLRIASVLQDLGNLTLTEEGLSGTGKSYQMNLTINWTGYSDSRAQGALLIFRQGAPSYAQLNRTTILPETIKDDGGDKADTLVSGETAVKRWTRSSGTASLGTDYFGASYYNQRYSFRIVVYGANDDEPYYYYAPGYTNTSLTTPYPSSVRVESIETKIHWTYTSGAEDDPEFIIDEDLETAGGNFIQDLATRIEDQWKPVDEGDYDLTHTVDRSFSIPAGDEGAELFQIVYDIDEDEPAGEHDFVDSEREIQFVEVSEDGLYGMNDEGKYSGSSAIDTETYSDNDKGKLTMTWTVNYITAGVD